MSEADQFDFTRGLPRKRRTRDFISYVSGAVALQNGTPRCSLRDTLIGKELKRESKNPREAVRPVYGKEMVKGGKEAWITG